MIPTYDKLLKPVLELATRGDITRRSATTAIVEQLRLSPEEAEQRLPSGVSTVIHDRVNWAMSFLTKAKLIAKIAPRTYRATEFGHSFLREHPETITVADLQAIPGWVEAWRSSERQTTQMNEPPEIPGMAQRSTEEQTSTPQERIELAFNELRQTLIDDLRAQLAKVDPFRFEQIVIDLLLALGYGGSRREAAAVTQKTNDEGIDGVINEDRLGLDSIYVQAKRWQGNVGREAIQNFVGALAGKRATKGVFITTSGFNSNATAYANNLPQKIILIDGKRLAELMIEHGIGVSEEHAYKVKKIDSDYFEEG